MTAVYIPAWRFVHGKVCAEPGGPVTPGFEHRPTSISTGLPAPLLPLCRPGDLLDNQSLQALVHPERERDGALWFWPAGCDGQRFMLASCVRARPESGEGGLSRTHTQLITYIFKEADWNAHAPRLIANATRWLRAEPDTLADFERFIDTGAAPLVDFDESLLPEEPRCVRGPLVRPGALLWRLTGALEVAGHNLPIGPADGIRSVAMFLKALACVAALLPAELRIYLTAAAGFALPLTGPQRPFALQYRPEAPALGKAEPGLLEQLARTWLQADPQLDEAHWQACWAARCAPTRQHGQSPTDAGAPPAPAGEPTGAAQDADVTKLLSALGQPRWHKAVALQTADLARSRYAEVCDSTNAQRSVTDLVAWLTGRLPAPPPRPALHHDNTGAKWVLALTRHLEDGLTREACEHRGLGRALARLATLIDNDPQAAASAELAARQRAQALFWAAAWRRAAAGHGRAVLRWAALLASPLVDELPPTLPTEAPALALRSTSARAPLARPRHQAPLRRVSDPHPLGWLADFDELRALFDAIARAQAEGGAAAELVAPLLKVNAVKRRIRDLRARAPRLLTRNPDGARALAAAYPALLAPRPDDAPDWLAASSATLHALLIATRLPAWHREPGKARQLKGDAPRLAELADAVARIAERSLGLDTTDDPLKADLIAHRDDHLQRLLWHYWHWAMAPDADRDRNCTLWRDGVVGLLRAVAPRDDPAVALRLLISRVQPSFTAAVGPDPDRTRAEPATSELFTACLDALVPLGDDPRAPNPAALAVGLLRALPDPRLLAPAVGGGLAADALGSALGLRLRDALRHPRADADLLARAVLPLLAEPCARLAAAPLNSLTPSAVAATLDLAWALLERLREADRLPREPIVALYEHLEPLAARGGSESAIADATDRLALTLAHCLLAWAVAEPPSFALPPNRPLAETPIRRRLARRLRYPRCVYFAGLTLTDDKDLAVRGIQTFSVGRAGRLTHHELEWPLTPTLGKAIHRLLGVGAAACWLALFNDPKSHNLLARLLREQTAAGASNEALAALADLVVSADPGYRAAIDSDIWFTIGFLAGFDPQRPTPAPRIPSPALTRALLSNGGSHQQQFAIHFGRLLAIGNVPLATPLVALFGHPDANARLARQVLLLDEDWDDFARLDDAARGLGLLRLLYLLALLRCESRVGAERRFIPEQDLTRALELAPRHPESKAMVADYLARQPMLRTALTDAARLVGLPTLPGWPL